METLYKVVYTGKLQDGFEYEDVVSKLVSISNMDKEKAVKFLSAQKPTLIKKDLPKEKAEKYFALFKKIGLQVQLVTSEISTQQNLSKIPKQKYTDNSAPGASSAPTQTAKIDTPKAPRPKNVPENPYASPKADLQVDKNNIGDWLDTPQKVAPSHGWLWIKKATIMFLEQPWMWLGMALTVSILLFLLNLIPFIGFVPYTILSIVFGGGLMMAAQQQDNGETVEFNYIFKGFSHNRNQLVVVGLLYLGGFFAIGLVMVLFIGAAIWPLLGIGPGDSESAAASMGANIPMFVIAILVGMALSIPLMMAIWFSTPLVAINDHKAWAACKLSLRACLKNWLAFLIYGLAFFVVGLIIMAIIGGGSGLLAYFFSSETSFIFAFLPILVMSLFMLPVMVIWGLSVFTGFKDIFYKSTNKDNASLRYC